MLTILHPGILSHIAELPVGLSPLTMQGEDKVVLVIKCPKEGILAAKMNRGFRFYLAPFSSGGVRTCSLITAFFDDIDNPLHIWTPLFQDDLSDVLCRLLGSESFDVHFFDENNRELLGYHARNESASALRSRLSGITFLPLSLDRLRQHHDQAVTWFVTRTAHDDEQAFEIKLDAALFPDDLMILDLRQTATKFHGAPAVDHTSLEREGDPGKFQERDIVNVLQRVFPADEIYLNPQKVEDGRELVDVLVISQTNVLLIQAKDSPNTERSLRRTLSRKMTTVEGHISKAVNQLAGALSHIRSRSTLTLLVGGKTTEISLKGRTLWGLVVLNETFDTEYSVYSPPLLALARESGIPCLLLGYHELHNFLHHRHTEAELVATFRRTFDFALKHNQYPRSRFGFVRRDDG
jgi:hypothetical protein